VEHLTEPLRENFPIEQDSQEDVPDENVPAGHTAHAVAPTAFATDPARHSVHESVLLLENLPCGQNSQLISDENFPGLHDAQEDDPSTDVAVPFSQSLHDTAPSSPLYFPASQAKHSELRAYRPGAQGVQTVAPALDVDPASHVLHDEAPGKDVRPAWQVEQEVLPVFGLNVPAVQIVATLLPMN
jgi:hypothetical protein